MHSPLHLIFCECPTWLVLISASTQCHQSFPSHLSSLNFLFSCHLICYALFYCLICLSFVPSHQHVHPGRQDSRLFVCPSQQIPQCLAHSSSSYFLNKQTCLACKSDQALLEHHWWVSPVTQHAQAPSGMARPHPIVQNSMSQTMVLTQWVLKTI